jgi:formylglycine-generating enzyme required for sulfatase activity
MHGNVWEWCSDRWHENYNGAPTDGSCWETGKSEYRVVRGGSWDNFAVNCRSVNRNRLATGGRHKRIGFRVAVDFG